MNNKNDAWNKDMRLSIFILLVLSIFILSSIEVNALGVAPSRKIVEYSPGEQSYTIRIVNNENKDMRVMIYFQGELAEYASISQNIITVNSNEPEKSVTYNVKIPTALTPGTKKLDVMMLELGDNIDTENIDMDKTMIFSTVLIVHQLRVNVPYPGVFAEGVLYVSEAGVNETMTFTVNVLNKGTSQITGVGGELVIYGPTNEEIRRIKSNSVAGIAPGQSDKLAVNVLADINPGLYSAEFIVNYGDKQFVLRDNFRVGSQFIDVEGIRVENFKLGTIAKFDVDLLNKWNQPISDVYADMKVLNSQSIEVSSFKTAPTNLKQLSHGTITGYWDTREVDVGNYDIKVILNYEGKTVEKIFRTVVGIDSIKLQDSSFSGQVVSSGGQGNKLSLLYILVGISIFLNLGLFIYFKFMRKKSPELNNDNKSL